MSLPREIVKERLLAFLKEDVGQGDITSQLVIQQDLPAEADVIAKEKGVIAGIEEAGILLEAMKIKLRSFVKDGSRIEPGETLMHIEGNARDILAVERTLMNLLSRMSGIATATKDLQDKVMSVNSSARVASTRKVAPGCLYFDKRAVQIGGGDLHRLHLDDLILIKDNHKALVGDLREAIRRARKGGFAKKVEVEVTSAEEAIEAVEAGADIVMFDNMTPAKIKSAIERIKDKQTGKAVVFEASGGINSSNILEYASSGVHILSSGSLTHSVKSLDLSLKIKSPNQNRVTSG
jgi:nicotinate-nucleotide pyrophosphorylase (carboxylating)